MSALWRIVLMRFWRSLSGILACNPKPLPLGKGLIIGAAAPATLLGASPQTPFIFFKEVFLQSEILCTQMRAEAHSDINYECNIGCYKLK